MSGEFRLILQPYEKGNFVLAQTRVFAMCSEVVVEVACRHQVKQENALTTIHLSVYVKGDKINLKKF